MDTRMGVRYEDILAQRAEQAVVPLEMHGSSGYFSKPTPDLDPRLFPPMSETLHPSVRLWILHTLYHYWGRIYRHPQHWSTVWIAGSGITHQWSAGRALGDQPGDLDVLIGVDWERFFIDNPGWRGTPNGTVAGMMNEEFHAGLWPSTAHAVLPAGGAPFEVTFYVNELGTDIRAIHPYAAYNVTDDEWTVHPADLPDDWDPQTYFPAAWWAQVNAEASDAAYLLRNFRSLREQARHQQSGTPTWLNTMTRMHHTVRAAGALYDNVHTERKRAFGPDGAGYGDYYNFRWQAHKFLGSSAALHVLASLDGDAHRDYAVTQCENGGILDATHALLLAQKAAARSL